MDEEQHSPDMTDPIGVWRAFQETNLEVWARSMASLVNNETYAQALSSFLDSYLATSAPFRKILDQYMGFWLSNLNMPSRDEVLRLEQRLHTSESRLNSLAGQMDQVLKTVQGVSGARPSETAPPAAGQSVAELARVDSSLQALEARVEQVVQAVQGLATQQEAFSSSAPAAPASSHADETEDRVVSSLQALEKRLGELERLLQERPVGEPGASPLGGDIEARLQTLDEGSQRVLQTLQALHTTLSQKNDSAGSSAPSTVSRSTSGMIG